MLNSEGMTDSAIARVRAALTAEELHVVCRVAAMCKRGVIERKSPQKALAARRNAEIALAVRQGRLEDADRLRWLYYPEKMRAKQLASNLAGK